MTELEKFMTILEVQLGIHYTDEQKLLASDFTKSRISFSSPGTGKTRTAIGGLLIAELFHKVPGNKIYALSFTRAATGEIKNRHLEACEKLRIKQTINFSTLHSICTSIIKDNYYRLGMEKISISSNMDIGATADMIMSSGKEWGQDIAPWQARMIVRACRELNSALIFDPTHVMGKKCFMECRISYELFTRFRRLLYQYNKLTETIQVGDILLYTLEILTRFPEVGRQFKEKCRILLIDEFQDLSLLQLRIISLIADTVIAIGDIKQQIYAFNGACQEIVEQFFKYYPDAVNVNLTQSFRCKNEIADFATQLILANHVGGNDFKGTGDGGIVEFKTQTDFDVIAQNTADELAQNHNNFLKSKLFLFRNNFSAIPLVESFFRFGVPMRVNKYPEANRLPVVSDLCQAIMLAQNPYESNFASILNVFIPEFQAYKRNEINPLMKLCKKLGQSIFEINYSFKDPITGNNVMTALMNVREMLNTGATVRDMFCELWPIYKEYYLEEHAYQFEMEPEYYTRLVSPLIANKTFNQFLSDEIKKRDIIEDCNNRDYGVRCFTFHSAKGLEADEVYIVDANADIIPSKVQIQKLEKARCTIDIAREVRNERSLVYVACTRAKEKLVIYHQPGNLSSLFTPTNNYEAYDQAYASYKEEFNDVEVFQNFFSTDV